MIVACLMVVWLKEWFFPEVCSTEKTDTHLKYSGTIFNFLCKIRATKP